MPSNKCSAAMGFQVGFKSVGFFFVFKGNHIFDAPRFVFGCVRNIAFIMFFQAGSQIFGTANVEMGSGCFVYKNVNVMKVSLGPQSAMRKRFSSADSRSFTGMAGCFRHPEHLPRLSGIPPRSRGVAEIFKQPQSETFSAVHPQNTCR